MWLPEAYRKSPTIQAAKSKALTVGVGVKAWYGVCMHFDLTGFSADQNFAFLDLMILAMHADGHLSSPEDETLQKLLAAMGFVQEPVRRREFDQAVARITPSLQSIPKSRKLALALADAFTVRPQQKQVYAAVEEIMTFDNNISTWENTLLMELRMKFRL